MATNNLTTMNADLHINGALSSKTFNAPDVSIANAAISATAAIAATKVESSFGVTAELAESSTNVAAVTKLVHIVRGVTGEIVGFEVAIMAAMTTDRTLTVDLQKSTAGGAFATVLSSAISLTDATVVRTATAGTINSADLVDGDILEMIVALGGSSGTFAQGLVGTVILREDPE